MVNLLLFAFRFAAIIEQNLRYSDIRADEMWLWRPDSTVSL